MIQQCRGGEIRHGIFICTDVNTYVHSRDARPCVSTGVLCYFNVSFLHITLLSVIILIV